MQSIKIETNEPFAYLTVILEGESIGTISADRELVFQPCHTSTGMPDLNSDVLRWIAQKLDQIEKEQFKGRDENA